MSKFNNKYRISSARLQHWDYSADGTYFITICTHNQVHHFGQCKDGQMQLSTMGAIVQGFWYEIPKHFPFVCLGEFQVMPNHIHGLLSVYKETYDYEENKSLYYEKNIESAKSEKKEHLTPKDKNNTAFFSEISPKKGSISTIIRSYKSICSKHIHKTFPHIEFEWQERFWDNIVVNEKSFQTIKDYIVNNPHNWDKDQFYGQP